MIKSFAQILILSTLFLSPLSQAESAFDMQQLQSLFKSYQRQAAYDYASQYVTQMEGDPYFDYFYGVSAIDAGHASQGVFALERVLLVFPDDHVARLEIARGYFLLEEYARSRQEFEVVMATEPPAEVQETASRYLDAIRVRESRYRTTSNGYIELGYGSDSNVNSGVNDDNPLVLANILNATSVSQDDSFSSLTLAWQITQPFSPGWMFNTGVTANIHKNAKLDVFDNQTGTAQLGVTRISEHSRYKSELLFQQYKLDGNAFRNMSGLTLEWFKNLDQKSSFSTNLLFAKLDYPDQKYRNATLSNLTLSYQQTFSGSLSPYFSSSLTVGTEQSDNPSEPGALENTERDILGLRAGLLLSLAQKLGLQTSVSWQNSSYAAEQIVFSNQETRDDNYISAEAKLLWLFAKDWRLDTKFLWSDNSSNLDIYSFDRTLVSVNLNYAF